MYITKGGNVSELLRDIPIPRMFCARQTFPSRFIPPEKIRDAVYQQLSRRELAERIRSGMRIAVTAGSREICNVDGITRAIADFVMKERAAIGCPLLSSMEMVELGVSSRGCTVYMDKYAYEADGVIIDYSNTWELPI